MYISIILPPPCLLLTVYPWFRGAHYAAAVWEEATQPHILAVAPFMPYATDTGPGLQGEVSGSGGVLGGG
jgi:hypothetical protein